MKNPTQTIGKTQPTVDVFPAPIIASRAPATSDINYPIGQSWIYSGLLYALTAKSAGSATWILDASPIIPDTLTNHGVVIGRGAAPMAALAVAATGTVLAGVTGSDPAFTATPSVTSLTATTVNGTTITTNVAAAQISMTATTIAATGTDANVSLNITTKGTGDVVYAQSKAGEDHNIQITNSDNTAADSRAGLQIAVGGSTSTGDPYVRFEISGVAASTMSMGLDNSASDIFCISNSNNLGTSNALTLTQAGALTATTSITATLGAITATNGNLVLGTAGNKLSIATGVNASVGTATLVGGTATVSTTAVTASSVILLTRQSIGATGAAALGQLTVGTVVAGTSFVINAVQAADATALQASDVSVIGYQIIN